MRRLAAIMFTDIAGYTRIMQESEARASQLRQRHRAVFERYHEQFNGEILQYYGDGTLSIFDSCVDALNCAVDIQQELQKPPKVPLRIGIHLGDIVRTESDVYGDGVNIAARVESLGIPYAVLISDDVRKQVKNHEIEVVSMGHFEMKNVTEPLEVFAVKASGVIVPNAVELQGKAKRLEVTGQWIRPAAIGFVIMAMGAILFWTLRGGSNPHARLLPDDVREEKVAVSVFENQTGDENLDAMGYLASEWISSGLRELDIRTVSPEMVRQHKDKIGILPKNLEGTPSFAEITGAKYVITGSYYPQEDSILLNTRLSSTVTGEEIKTFPPIIGQASQKEAMIEEARQLLLGYWILKRDQKLSNINPPKYEAYQIFLKCNPIQAGCYQKALDADPEFLLARVLKMGSLAIRSRDSIYQADKAFVEDRWDRCTDYEKNWFRVAVFAWEANNKGALEAHEALYQLDSNDYHTIHQTAYAALNGNNMPFRAIQIYERLFSNIELYQDQILPWSFRHYTDALNRIGEHKTVTDFYTGLPEHLKQKAGIQSIENIARAFIHQNRIAEALEIVETEGNPNVNYVRAAYAYNCIFPDSMYNPFDEGLRVRVATFPDRLGQPFFFRNWHSKIAAYYSLRDWKKLEQILLNNTAVLNQRFEEPFEGYPEVDYWNKIWHTALLGTVYARLERIEECETQIDLINHLDSLYDERHALWERGVIPLLKARIYAILGRKELAVDHLEMAMDQGLNFGYWNMVFDMDFVSLKGYSPFEELIKPRAYLKG